jgi:hypothetical protein
MKWSNLNSGFSHPERDEKNNADQSIHQFWVSLIKLRFVSIILKMSSTSENQGSLFGSSFEQIGNCAGMRIASPTHVGAPSLTPVEAAPPSRTLNLTPAP